MTQPSGPAGAPSVLIVGAGAVGLSTGYHLALGGADVTFLVRPGRKDAFAAPRHLYCYDDGELKRFDGYGVEDDVAGLELERLEHVIVTLDGHTSRTPESTVMLSALGDAIRDTPAVVITIGMGIGLREHYLQTMRIPGERLLRGIPGMLSHQAGAGLPTHPPTDPALVAEASICYRHPSSRVGLRIAPRPRAAAKRFAALYDRCRVSRCKSMSGRLMDVVADAVFPIYAACDIAGWPPIAEVVADKELWRLACRAQGEIIALPGGGWFGKAMAPVFGPRLTAMIHVKSERATLPLDLQAFNRFHHGGKVRAQDVEVLRNCLADGQRHGRPMTALRALLARLDEQLSTP